MASIIQDAGASSVKVQVPNISANGNILTAATSVDIATNITFTQTTAGVTATLLNPTVTTVNKTITLQNLVASTQSLTITALSGDTFTIAVGQSIEVIWNGTSWRLVNPAQVLPEYGEAFAPADVTTSVTTNTAAVSFIPFTLPSAGVWEVEYMVRAVVTVNSGASGALCSCIYDPSGTLILNTGILVVQSSNAAASNVTTVTTGAGVTRITTAAAATYSVRVFNPNTAPTTAGTGNQDGRSSVKWKKISGFTSATGQTVDYISAGRTVNQTGIVNNVATDVIFNQVTAGNIPLNTTTGVFSLMAGKTYELTAALRVDSTSATDFLGYSWVDAITNAFLSTALNNTSQAVPTTYSTTNPAGQSTISLVYTPVADQTVKLRTNPTISSATVGPSTVSAVGSYATIKQLGSSSVIAAVPISILQLDNTGATAQAATTAAAGTAIGISWNTAMFTKGSKITFVVNNGTVTLAGGANGTTYRLTGKVATAGSTDSTGSYVFYRFYNVTTAALLGSEGYNADPDNGASGAGWNEIPSSTAYAYITVPAGVTQQVRLAITSSSATPGNLRQQAGQTSCTIEEIER